MYVLYIRCPSFWQAYRISAHLGHDQTAASSSFAHDPVHADWIATSLLALLDPVAALLHLLLAVHVGLALVLER